MLRFDDGYLLGDAVMMARMGGFPRERETVRRLIDGDFRCNLIGPVGSPARFHIVDRERTTTSPWWSASEDNIRLDAVLLDTRHQGRPMVLEGKRFSRHDYGLLAGLLEGMAYVDLLSDPKADPLRARHQVPSPDVGLVTIGSWDPRVAQAVHRLTSWFAPEHLPRYEPLYGLMFGERDDILVFASFANTVDLPDDRRPGATHTAVAEAIQRRLAGERALWWSARDELYWLRSPSEGPYDRKAIAIGMALDGTHLKPFLCQPWLDVARFAWWD